MAIRINNISLGLEEEKEALKDKAAKRLRVSSRDLTALKILRESIDARKKDSIKFNYTVQVECEHEASVVRRANDKNILIEAKEFEENFDLGNKPLNHRPIIVGMGPAGMFAGLLMAEKGFCPIIIERGEKVEERTRTVERFWNTGILNSESNVQFGEGGAGTFSDGKLTTRIKDARCDLVIQRFVEAGAPEEIIYSGKPHIGTDILKNVVKNIRDRIIKLGGEVRFSSKLEDIRSSGGKLKSIIVNGEEIPCDVMIAAIGHSSRDTYTMLYSRGISMSAKPFAIGVRAEHLQNMIDVSQYGKFAGHPRLRAADYRLTYTTGSKRAVYTFCMCPGGVVVAAASEEGRLVTNGMSYYKRDGKNANSAVVVSVGPEDFGGSNPLSGMEFQRHYEKLAYETGGHGYYAPVQLLGDFMKESISTRIGAIVPSYKPGYEFSRLNECLPGYVCNALKEGFLNFDRKIKGFAEGDVILTGIETRTSAPVRIERNEKLQSISLEGLYPSGEGAGYAGGIISAAVDGLKCAESIMKDYYYKY